MKRPLPLPPQSDAFKSLFSFKLNVLAHRMSQLAALMNQQNFDLDARQWRIIGLLGSHAPLSLQSLANEVGIDKSQASRIVAVLIDRDLLRRNAHEEDGRSIQLSLTSGGKSLYKKAFPQAVRRNQELLSVLSPTERESFESALDLLLGQATHMLGSARRTRKPRPPGA